MLRTWFYTQLSTPALVAMVPGGIHQTTELVRAPDVKPFLTYRTIANVPQLRGDDQDHAIQENYLVFVHDEEGDYLQIDAVLEALRQLFKSVNGDPEVISVTWLENSEDLRDADMGTIMRYGRYQVNYKAA